MPSDELPTFFRAALLEALDAPLGYANAGYHLALHFEDLLDSDEELEAVDVMASAPDAEEAIWQWTVEKIPRCAGLVPARGRESFVKGIMRAIDEERV